ncbi:MAG: hypothetical protein KJO07_18745, partial [Deltaproteobacteria bacterium]|nr:hypothetical protein [Deltaproteobacteria bacterium]
TWTYHQLRSKPAEVEIRKGNPHGKWVLGDDDDSGPSITYAFDDGKLLSIDGKKVDHKDYDYHPETFVETPREIFEKEPEEF